MRLIVLAGHATLSNAGWHVRDLARAAEDRRHEFIVCAWPRLSGNVGTNGPVARDGEVVLDEADVVMPRTMPAGTLEQIVFRMDLVQRLEGAGILVVNGPRSVEVAVDKYLALTRMQEAGLPVPPTIVCQHQAEARAAFARLGGDVVIKPIFGSEGFGMIRVSDGVLADRAFSMLDRMGNVLYLQRYIEHDGCDIRLFVIDGRVVTAMRRCGDGFRTNIAQGGTGTVFEPGEAMCDLARRAAAACDVCVGGVDVLIDGRGEPFVLEVNAVPGWRALTRVTGLDIGMLIVKWLEEKIRIRDG